MKIIFPKQSKIIELQGQEKKYYYSHCIENILRKNGYLSIHSQYGKKDKFSLMCRRTPWKEEYQNDVLFIEGPCDDSLYAELGLKYSQKCAQDISLESANSKGVLNCGQISVRTIPKDRRTKFGEITPFCSRNEFYNNHTITYHEFEEHPDWEPILYSLNQNGHKKIVGIRKEKIVIVGVPIFDLLVLEHTFPPLEEAGFYSMSRAANLGFLEDIALSLFHEHFLSNGAEFLQVDPWPSPYKAALTIRHDFDRPISDEHLTNILEFYKKKKIKATWFWLVKTYNKHQIEKVDQAGHEIAFHSEQTGSADFYDEVGYFSKRKISTKGYSSHGGRGALGYVGEKTFEYALESKMEYGELLGKEIRLPCRAITVDQNNLYGISRLMLPPTHFSFDKTVRPNEHYKEHLLSIIDEHLDRGNHFVLMNHPDIHTDALKEFLTQTKKDWVWYETLDKVCDWVNFLKYKSQIRITEEKIVIDFSEASKYDFSIKIKSEHMEKYVEIKKETQSASLDRKNKEINLLKKASLEPYFKDFEFLITQQVSDPIARKSAISVNTTQLAARTRKLIDISRISREDKVMELGCGYGFLAVALSLMTGAQVAAFDISTSYLSGAKDLLKLLSEQIQDRVKFAALDYTTYESSLADSFDVVVLNNTFCYIPVKKQRLTVEYLYRYLKKGGRVFFYHPNPYYHIEPFNKVPFVHWLPKWLGEKIVKRFGSRTLSDLNYNTPFGLYRSLKKVGFKNIRYIPSGNMAYKKSRWIKFFTPYYAMIAEK